MHTLVYIPPLCSSDGDQKVENHVHIFVSPKPSPNPTTLSLSQGDMLLLRYIRALPFMHIFYFCLYGALQATALLCSCFLCLYVLDSQMELGLSPLVFKSQLIHSEKTTKYTDGRLLSSLCLLLCF